MLHRFEDVVPVVNERVILWPDFLNHLHARVMTVRMDGDQPAARPERARQRRDHALGLELERGAGAVRLRSDDEIVISAGAPGARDDRIEQETVIVAVNYEHYGPFVDRVAGARGNSGLPVLHQERLKPNDLLFEAVRGITEQGQFVPDEARRGIERFDVQPRRVGIGEIGQDQHRRRMLEEAIRHFLQRKPHVFERDFLADCVERHMRKAIVHRPHDPRQHRAVTDAGVEDPDGGRMRMDMR